MSDFVKILEEQLMAEREKLAQAKAALSDEDRREIGLRKEIAQTKGEREEEERTKRQADLDRRLDAARVKLPEATFEGVMVKGFPDTFIVRRNGRAHAAWLDASSRSHVTGGKRADREQMHKKYAMDVIYDWNGITFEDGPRGANPEDTRKLSKFLDENPGVITPITDEAVRLAGVFADARSKSD